MEISPVARELRLAREAAGVTLEKAAEMMSFSVSLVSQVERGRVPASPTYVRQAQQLFPPAPGYYERVRDDGLRRTAIREWLRDWFDVEQQAEAIRWWEPSVVPALLQTEAYARILLRTDVEVSARLEWRQVFAREDPPDAVFIIRERVLDERIGGPEVMAEQLQHLAESTVPVQVLPADTDTYARLSAPFVMATVGARDYVFLESAVLGFTLEEGEVVSTARQQWEALAREALPARHSRELIVRATERWKSES